MLFADAPWHNAELPTDVDASGEVAPVDALLVINALNSAADLRRAAPDGEETTLTYLDVNDDQIVSAIDALFVINEINAARRTALAALVNESAPALLPCGASDASLAFITRCETQALLNRAAAASSSEDAIIAIVDRGGRILGVRVVEGVRGTITDDQTLVFAIDGAVAKARTAAFFANGRFDPVTHQLEDGVGPLTSRTVRFISQSTITQREVESNPTVADPAVHDPFDPNDPSSLTFGPGWVAPIGLGGHFPPAIQHTPPVDLFAIEHQSRDSLLAPGADGYKGTADDIPLARRFNADPVNITKDILGQEQYIEAPESYGATSARLPWAQSRGIATLPGGIPLYKDLSTDGLGDTLVGGIGVFFPGLDGYATHEQRFIPGIGQSEGERLNSSLSIESEWIAFAAAGGSVGGGAPVGSLGIAAQQATRVPGYDLPFGRIDLAGITLELYGPHPTASDHRSGIRRLLDKGSEVGQGSAVTGMDQVVSRGTGPLGADEFYRDGKPVPEGWLIQPHAGSALSANQVADIVQQGISAALQTRAAIRVPLGSRTRMVFAVSDLDGSVLGLYRMPDATVFSIDVAVAKARNVAYYSDINAVQPEDLADDDLLVARGRISADQLLAHRIATNGQVGRADLFVDAASTTSNNNQLGVAFTNRTFRFLAEPRYPSGVDGSLPPIFSILNDEGINPTNAENDGPPRPASSYQTVLGFDAFHASRNLHDPDNLENQNGVVFFPGSTPLYVGQVLVGGFGVSGDGVDQDDVVTAAGMVGFAPPVGIRADQFFYRGVRLPFQKYNRNPNG